MLALAGLKSRTMFGFMIACVVIICLALPWPAKAQNSGSSPGESAKSPVNSAKPPLSEGDRITKEAYLKSKAVGPKGTIDEYSELIKLCQDGIDGNASKENTIYLKKLQAWGYMQRGEKKSDAEDDKSAVSDFDNAAKLDPTLSRAIHDRGFSRAKLGDTKAALEDFNTAIDKNPNYANSWFDRAEIRYDQGDFNAAVQDYNQAIKLKPDDGGFYNSRGHALYRLGKFRDALSDYNQAVRLNPDDAATLVNRGDAFRDLGMYPQAASDYRDAVRLNPKLGRAYLSTAWLMATCADARFRDQAKAVTAAQRAIELDGDKDYRYLDTLAAAQANSGQFEDAKATAKKAVAAAPSSEAAHVRQRLDLYENNRAYREGAPAEPVRSAARTQ